MNIWIIDHYAVPPKYYPLARQTIFARKLGEKGHTVTVFCASSVHNSDLNLSNGADLFREETVDGVKYVYVTCRSYQGNGIRRILNMLEFARKLPAVCKQYERPDAVLACSMTLQACRQGIKLARKYGAKAVAQITDLWPETLIAYGIAGKCNPAVFYLRRIEKWIYTRADSVIFSMEGAYDYIREQHWEKSVPESRVYFINNGVDLEAFDYNKTHYTIADKDLDDLDTIKAVYVGSIRKVNNLGMLLDIAKAVRNPKVRFLIWGEGDERHLLEKRVEEEHISNVTFKGGVDKKYVAYISSKADINLLHSFESSIFRFGSSMNKMFDYFAAGKPIFCDFECRYNPAIETNSGECANGGDATSKAGALDDMLQKDLSQYGINARTAAEEKYNFDVLSERLIRVLE
ncbi:Glycosyltransferase involved in cell wall bisynthesis [Lachnospiraceae bacterium YSD2013]|nr:Glycosyltransferase involved in cell wall bisynthesis [Lachnospiraceae bacterium YSD2013]